jgi:hypothetical protein
MKKYFLLLILLGSTVPMFARQIISTTPSTHNYALPAVICTDEEDDWLIHKVASLLQTDIKAVTGKAPAIVHARGTGRQILIGTLRGSKFIKELSFDSTSLHEQWEAFSIQTLADGTLLIVGSDKRGTAYGVLELSKQLGVSPWYWWADVPVQQKKNVYVEKGKFDFGPPAVQYRGIFINDEAPAFSGWTREKFGGFNHLVYEKMFELLLRLRGNYLWPAMWGNAFNDDDTTNPVLADKWGIVMGTSHHEPMLRAQAEWKRYGKGPWDYTKNEAVLKAFWRKGIENMGKHESIVTVGMRGDGDMPMTEGTATALLEKIVKEQRQIIRDVTGKPAEQTPQLWALYKEVQDYYDKGMRVPDDVTLLLCDDNWGNIRRLPDLKAPPRTGGYGIYYHFDYVGDPRNYKWVNTNNLARVWEQLHLAKAYGADKIWIVNVGDLKPMELPISFFMDYAWHGGDTWEDYYSKYFGKEIGGYLRDYSIMAARRKPELLDEYSYPLPQYKEIVQEWAVLAAKVEKGQRSAAYFQLVEYPVKAMYNLHQLYYAVALYKSDPIENKRWADSAKAYYVKDSLLTIAYHQVAGGKWNHMMDQTHIGYTGWQQPERNSMPDLAGPYKAPAAPQVYLTLAAEKYVKAVGSDSVEWRRIPGIGKFSDGMTTFPVTHIAGEFGPRLDYAFEGADVNVYINCSPTLNFLHGEGLQYAVSVDDGPRKVMNLNGNDDDKDAWSEWVAGNVIRQSVPFKLPPGKHVLHYWMISPGVILQGFDLEKL